MGEQEPQCEGPGRQLYRRDCRLPKRGFQTPQRAVPPRPRASQRSSLSRALSRRPAPRSHAETGGGWSAGESAGCAKGRGVSALGGRSLSCLLLRAAGGRCEARWAACTAPEADSDLAGGVLGEAVAQRRLVEAPPVRAEVVIVVHVIQHFAGQLLQSAGTTWASLRAPTGAHLSCGQEGRVSGPCLSASRSGRGACELNCSAPGRPGAKAHLAAGRPASAGRAGQDAEF